LDGVDSNNRTPSPFNSAFVEETLTNPIQSTGNNLPPKPKATTTYPSCPPSASTSHVQPTS
jgi:hypothetical protein